MNNKQCHFRWPRSSRLNLVCLRRLWFRRRHLNVRNHQNGDYISTILQVLQLYHQSGLRHNKKSLLPILIILSTLPCFHFQAQFRVQDRCVAQALMAPWSSGESRHTVRWGFTIWMSNDEHGNSMTLDLLLKIIENITSLKTFARFHEIWMFQDHIELISEMPQSMKDLANLSRKALL